MSDQGQIPPPQGPPGPPQGYGYGYAGAGGPVGPQPENYLVWSILSTVFCCLPLGIVSIVFSAQVSSKWQMGDQAGALESSRKAKQFALWSTIIGAVLIVLIIVFYVVVFVVAINSSGSTTDYDNF